jgi:amino acid transporter
LSSACSLQRIYVSRESKDSTHRLKAAQTAYFIVLPKNLVSHSNTVGLDFGKEMFGPAGGIAFAAIVAMSCFGAVNSSFFTSSRIIFVAAKEGYLPKRFGKLHLTRKTPINSIVRETMYSHESRS